MKKKINYHNSIIKNMIQTSNENAVYGTGYDLSNSNILARDLTERRLNIHSSQEGKNNKEGELSKLAISFHDEVIHHSNNVGFEDQEIWAGLREGRMQTLFT